MKKSIKILFLASISVISLFQFTGCNTVDGIGEDIERAGEKIQDSSN